MGNSEASDSLRETLGVFDSGEPGEPLTTSEVSALLDVSQRGTYERLDRLADRNELETKKVGANGRVWWRPVERTHEASSRDPVAGRRARDSDPSRSVEAGTADEVIPARDVFEDVAVGVFLLDSDFEVVWVNRAAERYFGLGRERVVGRDKRTLVEDRVAPTVEDPAAFTEKVLDTYDDTAHTEQFECHVTAGESRQERWLEHRSRPIESGAYAGGRVELYYDVTDRKRSQPTRDAGQKVIEAIEDYAIVRLDSEGQVRSWNAGAERIKGYAAEEILGEDFATFYTESDRENGVPERHLETAAETGRVENEGWRVREDGSRFRANVTITTLRDDGGDFTGYVTVTRDVTERRERERKLREEKAFTESILDNQRDIVYAFDTDWNILRWNDRLQQVTGYTDDEIERMQPVEFIADEAVEHVIENIDKMLEGESVTVEAPLLTAEGDETPFEFSGFPLTTEDGDVRGFAGIGRDISERKAKERRLRRQYTELKRELDDVFTRIDDAFYGLDEQLRFTYVNDRAEELLQQTEAELIGERIWEAFPEAKETIVFEEFHCAIETQEPTSFELYYDPLGFWARAHVYPSENGLSVYFRDVTDRKERERELRRYETIVETVEDGIYAVDDDGRFLMVNEALCDLTGYDRDDLIDEHATTVYDEKVSQQVESMTTDIATGERDVASLDLDIVTRAGDRVPCESRFTLFPLSDDQFGRCGVVRDISVRKERERELARFKKAVEASGHAIYMTDTNGQVTYANSTFEEMTGYSASDVVGESASVLQSDADDGDAPEPWNTVYETDVWEEDVVGHQKDGERYHARQTVAPVKGDSGDIVQYIAVQKDVTGRKRFEDRLKALNTASRDLLAAETGADVAEVVVETVADMFDVPGSVIYGYDESAGQLDPLSQSVEDGFIPDGFPPVPADEGSLAGRVFRTGAPRYYEDVTESSSMLVRPEHTDMRTGSFVPIGTYGILVVGAQEVDAFDADIQQLVELLAASAEEAWERVEREQELERRIRQQEVVTDLGQHALEDRDIDSLMAEAAECVADTLDNDYCKVLDLDHEAEDLLLRQGVGWDEGIVGEATVSAVEDDSQAAYTLASDRPVVVDDLAAETRFSGPDLLTSHDVRSGISVIIGPTDDPWGILGTHDTTPKQFTEHDVNFVQSVANILATAITRHDDELALVRQREQLAALNSLNEVFRGISNAVFGKSTREEVESVVCERLVDSDSYEFAWIGEIEHSTRTVTVRTETGVEDYLDDVTISVDPDDERSYGPTGTAVRTGEMTTTQNTQDDPQYEPWRAHAEEYGFRSSAAIPITHDDTTYGVLNVYADRPYAFTGRERRVVEQLGEVVGHAIAAIERKRALMSDEVVELGFHVSDIFETLDVEPADGRVTLDETIPLPDDEYLVYGTATGDATGTLTDIVETLSQWEEVTLRDGDDADDETAFELQLSEPPVLSTVASAGGTITEAVIEDGAYHMTVQLPPESGVRQVIDTVQDAYPSAEMVTRNQTTRGDDGARLTDVDIDDTLTERQHAALRAAYHAGFFEWPRKSSGEDVADSLGVSAPTFHQHLRKAEQKVFESVLASSVPTDG